MQTVTFVAAVRVRRYNVVDVVWGPGFVLVALAAVLVGDAANPRAWILVALTGVWGCRLGWHMARKTGGRGEDPRYSEMLARAGGGRATAARKIFATQGAAQWFVSLPIQVSAVAGPTSGAGWAVVTVGVALWLLGVVFETVGDRQLAAFRADPEHGAVMDRGLWAWTRHPNYFGDACVWWGVWLVAASAWPGMLTVASPAVMTYFLVFATGARLLERSMVGRPGYREYQRRTSMFVPWPPGSRRCGSS
nr:DUF1295 domain-containing protein [Rhodococcus sp. HNM0569]